MANFLQAAIGVLTVVAGIVTANPYLIMSGIFSIAGGLLAKDPADPPDPISQKRNAQSSAANVSPNQPIPIAYGQTIIDKPVIIYGPDISTHYISDTDYETVQSPGHSKIIIGYGLCQGPISGLVEVFTSHGVDLDELGKKKTVIVRTGTNTQDTVLELNGRIVSTVPVGLNIEKYDSTKNPSLGEDDNTITFTTTQKVQNIGLTFQNPQGLYFKGKGSDTRPAGIPGPKSCRMQVAIKKLFDSDADSIDVVGEALGTGTGSKKKFQTQFNDILTIVIKLNGNILQADAYSIDYATGEIALKVAPNNGVAITADYSYRVENYKVINWNKTTRCDYIRRDTTTIQDGTSTTVLGEAKPYTGKDPIWWHWGGTLTVPIERSGEGAQVILVRNEIITNKLNQKGKLVQTTETKEYVDSVPLSLPLERYTIRLRNKTPTVYTGPDGDIDDVICVSLEEIIYDDLRYPGLAYIVLKSNLTDNLENNYLDIKAIVKGRLVVDLDDYFTSGDTTRKFSENAANVVANILTDPDLKCGYALYDLDETSFQAFYDYCEEALEMGEWKEHKFRASGSLTTVYRLPDWTAGSEIQSVRLATGANYTTYVEQNAIGIKFTQDPFNLLYGTGPNPNASVPGQPATRLGQVITVKYRAVYKRGQCSATFDSITSHEEAIRSILEPLGAYHYHSGGKWKIAIDKDETNGTNTSPTAVLDINVQSSSIVQVNTDGLEFGDGVRTSIEVSLQPKHIQANVIKVIYRNCDNLYRDDVVIVEDPDSISQFGVVELRVEALGICTRPQALMYAKYLLRATQVDDISVSLSAASPQTQLLEPGDIINITDTIRDWGNKPFRIKSIRLNSIQEGMGTKLILIPYDNRKYTMSINNGSTSRTMPGTGSGTVQAVSTFDRSPKAKDISIGYK